MTVRQQIVDAIVARFQSILIANGYSADIGNKVHEWKTVDLDPVKLPALLLRDTTDTMPTEGIGDRRHHELAIETRLVFSGKTSAADARQMIGDVAKALGIDPTWGGLAYQTLLNSADIDMEHYDRLFCVAQVDFTVLYRTKLWTL